MNLNPSMSQSWSEGGIQLLGKTLPEENFAQVNRFKRNKNSDIVCLIIFTLHTFVNTMFHYFQR